MHPLKRSFSSMRENLSNNSMCLEHRMQAHWNALHLKLQPRGEKKDIQVKALSKEERI